MNEFQPAGPLVHAHRGSTVTTGSDPLSSSQLICFSHLRWDFVWQRPQHLLSRAARRFDVIVIEEPIIRRGAVPAFEITRRKGDVRIAVPILPSGLSAAATIEAQRVLVDRLLAQNAASSRILWYYTPMAIAFSHHLKADLCIYDNMDELSAFRGASDDMVANEKRLFERADLVFTGGISLYEAKRRRHASVHAFPSSIDVAHFAASRVPHMDEPSDLAGIPNPRIGFFGVIDERMDLDLVAAVADLRPDWQIVVIGPVVKIDANSLPRRPNIHWLGPKTYEELPRYLGNWQAGLMPFAMNESTRFISPTKTPEFLAAGLPVVSTPITDVVRTYGQPGLVAIAADAANVVAELEKLLKRDGAAWLVEVDRHLAMQSWDKTWAAMQDLMTAAIGCPNRRARTSSGFAAAPLVGAPAIA